MLLGAFLLPNMVRSTYSAVTIHSNITVNTFSADPEGTQTDDNTGGSDDDTGDSDTGGTSSDETPSGKTSTTEDETTSGGTTSEDHKKTGKTGKTTGDSTSGDSTTGDDISGSSDQGSTTAGDATTGDAAHLFLWQILCMAAVAVLIFCGVQLYRTRRKE